MDGKLLFLWQRIQNQILLFLLTTFILTVVFDLTVAIEVGLLLAIVLFFEAD